MIENLKQEILNIKNNVNNETEEILTDSYEIDISCLEFIRKNTIEWYDFFFDVLKSVIEKNENNIELSMNELLKYNLNKPSYKTFIDFIKNELTKYTIIKNIEDEKIIIIQKIENNPQTFKGLRNNQIIARNSNILNNFSSGVHNQIMGAGKSIIMLLTIRDHYCLNKTLNDGMLYIITCPRIEVLNKLFFENINNERFEINNNNKEYWKKNDIINLDNFKIHDRLNEKKKCLTLDSNNPNILIVNTDFLKILFEKKIIDIEKLNFIIFDECHGISANKLFDILHEIKFIHKKSIIGFSATPVRMNAEQKTQSIFSKNNDSLLKNNLNILSNYDLFEAIKDDVVLSPSYVILEIKKTCNKKIGKNNKNITLNVLTNIFKTLPYRKIICWCKTIIKLKEWYVFLKTSFKDLKIFCSTSKDSEHEKDNYDTNFDAFCNIERDAILLCVNRCKEGSDIKNLDCGILIDRVKKRSVLTSMQMVGRILRPDEIKLKKNGVIIDAFINDGQIEIESLTAHQVIQYYEKVLSLTDDESRKGLIDIYDKIKIMLKNTVYDETTETINVKIDENEKHDIKIKLELTTKFFDWLKFKTKLDTILDEKYEMDKNEKLKEIFTKLKLKPEFNVLTNFWIEYDKIKNNVEYPEKLYDDNKEFFDNNTWFEFMDYDVLNYYKTINECRNAILKISKKKEMNEKEYKKCQKIDLKIPPYPEEFYKKEHFTTIKNEFSLKVKTSKKL